MATYHPVISNDPDYRALDQRREEIAEARKANNVLVAAAQRQYDEALADWKAVAARGEDPGPQPPLEGVLDPEVGRMFTAASHDELAALRDAERRLIIDKAADYLSDLGGIEREALARAAKLTAELDAIVDELAPVIDTVRQVRQAIDDQTETAHRLDAATLIAVARSGGSVLQPTTQATTVTSGTMTYRKEPSTPKTPVLESEGAAFQARQGKHRPKPRHPLAGRR